MGVERPSSTAGESESTRVIERIVDLARWAPSGDNTQPWRVRPSASGLELYMLRRSSYLDAQFAGTHVAFGAFAEACRLAATRVLGVSCELSWSERILSSVAASGPDARIRFGAERGDVSPLAAHLAARHSNRRLYDATPPTAAQHAALCAAAAGLPSVRFALTERREVLRAVGEIVQLTDRTRLEHPQCHRELHAKLHWRAAAAERDGTGFFIDSLELAPHERALLRLTAPPWAMHLGNLVLRMSTFGGWYARRQVEASGALGLLWAEEWSPGPLLEAGRALQRVWLAASHAGLAVQVVGGATLLLRRLALADPDLARAHSRRLGRARALLRACAEVAPADQLVLILRLGRAPPASARSYRLSAAQLIVDHPPVEAS